MKGLVLAVGLLISAIGTLWGSSPCERHGSSDLSVDEVQIPMERDYRKLLESRLGVTGFDCGRSIDLNLGPEACVSVFSHVSGGKKTFWVTLTRPESSLWQVAAGVNNLKTERAANIKINRIDARISESRATLIKEASMQMLKSAQKNRVISSGTDSVRRITGGPIEYSIQRPGSSTLYGTRSGLPLCESKAHRLANLWDELIEYCETNAADRERVGAQIDRDARAVLSSKR